LFGKRHKPSISGGSLCAQLPAAQALVSVLFEGALYNPFADPRAATGRRKGEIIDDGTS